MRPILSAVALQCLREAGLIDPRKPGRLLAEKLIKGMWDADWAISVAMRINRWEVVYKNDVVLFAGESGGIHAGRLQLNLEAQGTAFSLVEVYSNLSLGDAHSTWDVSNPQVQAVPAGNIMAACIYRVFAGKATVLHPARTDLSDH